MNRRIIFLLFFYFFSSSLSAEELTKTILVEGHGSSYSDAVRNGLIEALKQVEGVSINSQKSYAKSIREKAVASEGTSSHDRVISKQSIHNVREATQGNINQYRIIKSQTDADEQWLVELEVKILKYKTPGISPHSLRKIAVIPFRTKTPSMSVMWGHIASTEISRQFSQKLVNELTQSRRFTVMDREYMTEYLKERNLVLSADASIAEQMKVGEALGVDYLLLGTITEFKADRTTNYIKSLDETVHGAKAQFNADFRIMIMATRQIKWSDSVKVATTPDHLEDIVKTTGTQGVIDFVLEQAANEVVHSSLDNIYPLKILNVVDNESIYLNQGGKMTHLGDLYDVYTKGQNINDPDTGLNIKIDGSKVATVKVTKVLAKYSLATLVDGELSKIEKGAILRKFKQPVTAEESKVRHPEW